MLCALSKNANIKCLNTDKSPKYLNEYNYGALNKCIVRVTQ